MATPSPSQLHELATTALSFEIDPAASIAPRAWDESLAPAAILRAVSGRIIWLSVFRHPGTHAIVRLWIRLHESAEPPSELIIEEQYTLVPQGTQWRLQRSLSLETPEDAFKPGPADPLDSMADDAEAEHVEMLLALFAGIQPVNLGDLLS